jgi:GT2 family glycosyltransferase
MTATVDVSICMVSLNCWRVLEPCLESLLKSQRGLLYEVIVVDNASSDGTPDRLGNRYPWVKVVRNDRNVGFTKANNQAIEQSVGRLILWLNTDTLLEPNSLAALCSFLEAHPKAGIVGPKVLNADGSFQSQCRRGIPTPFSSLCYFLGLDRIWPEKAVVAGYLLRSLPVDEPSQVDAVSGCCLLARREVWDQIGPLDEEIFGFGEDVDWCVRAKNVGWEVWYTPSSQIVHLKGQGGVHSKPFHKVWGIHQAMWVFYRKHLKAKYPWPVTALVALGVGVSLLVSMVRESVRAGILRITRRGS